MKAGNLQSTPMTLPTNENRTEMHNKADAGTFEFPVGPCRFHFPKGKRPFGAKWDDGKIRLISRCAQVLLHGSKCVPSSVGLSKGI